MDSTAIWILVVFGIAMVAILVGDYFFFFRRRKEE